MQALRRFWNIFYGARNSHGESSNTSVTAESYLAGDSSNAPDQTGSLFERLFAKHYLRKFFSPIQINVPNLSVIHGGLSKLGQSIDDDEFNTPTNGPNVQTRLKEFWDLFKPTEKRELAHRVQRGLTMVACLCLDENANMAFYGGEGQLAKFATENSADVLSLYAKMVPELNIEKYPKDKLLMNIVNVLEPPKKSHAGNAHEVAQSSASAAIDSHGESSNTSVTADADLSEKRHRVNSATATVDASETLPEKLFSSLILRRLVSPNTIQVTEKEMIPDKIDDLRNAMDDSGRFKAVLDDFCNLFKSTSGADLAYEAKRLLSMIACFCIDDEANRNYIRGTLTEYVSDVEMKKRVVHMLSLTDDEKRQLESLLLTIVGVLDPDKATCEGGIRLEDWIKREESLSYIFSASTDVMAARKAIEDAMHAGPNFDSTLVYSVLSSRAEQNKDHVLRKVRYLVKICCKDTFRDAFREHCLLKYVSEHISEIVETPSNHEEVEFVEKMLNKLVNEEVSFYKRWECYHDDLFTGQEDLLKNVKRLLWIRWEVKAEERFEYQFVPWFRTPESSTESILLGNCFIDKSVAYKKIVESNAIVCLACFPRRFGKTTMLRFFSEICGLQPASQKHCKELYRKCKSLEMGEYFLKQCVQPALYMSWSRSNPDPISSLRKAISYYLPGLRLRDSIDDTEQILIALYELFEGFIIPFLPTELKSSIDPHVLLLIDEIQAPHIAVVSAQQNRNNFPVDETLSRAQNHFKKIESFYRNIKFVSPTHCSRVILAGILRLSGYGLSTLQMEDFGRVAYYQDIVGITSVELCRSMRHIFLNGERMCEDAAITHILRKNKVTPHLDELTFETKLSEFYNWLKQTCNGFCFAFNEDSEDGRLEIYSPLDVIARLKVLFGFPCESESQWLEGSRTSFSSLVYEIAQHDRSLKLECLCGGTISRTSLYNRVKAEEYFSQSRASLLRLYFELGVLRVETVENSHVTLTPSISNNPQKVYNAVFGHISSSSPMTKKDAIDWCNDPKLFLNVIFGCIEESSKSLLTLFDCNYMREYSMQLMCFMKLMDRFEGEFATVTIEQSLETRQRMDICVSIYSNGKDNLYDDDSKWLRVVIECKLCRDTDFAKVERKIPGKIDEAYTQVNNYSELLHGDSIILAVVWGWTRTKLRLQTKCSSPHPITSCHDYSKDFLRV